MKGGAIKAQYFLTSRWFLTTNGVPTSLRSIPEGLCSGGSMSKIKCFTYFLAAYHSLAESKLIQIAKQTLKVCLHAEWLLGGFTEPRGLEVTVSPTELFSDLLREKLLRNGQCKLICQKSIGMM